MYSMIKLCYCILKFYSILRYLCWDIICVGMFYTYILGKRLKGNAFKFSRNYVLFLQL